MTHQLTVEAVLFDMDGTLVDSNAMVDRIWNAFADERGLDAAEVRFYAHGRPSTATVEHYVDDADQVREWIERIHTWESTQFDGAVAIPGAIDLVKALAETRWAVVTSALADAARARILSVGLPAPAVLIGADHVQRGKPDPQGFSDAAAALGVDARSCAVFEDTESGIIAGREAGCQVVVIGDFNGRAAHGLPRVRDMRQVVVSAASRAQVQLIIED